MYTKDILKAQIYFSYHQFMVFDEDIRLPASEPTGVHFSQGFVRRESTVTYRTLLQFGLANLTVVLGAYVPRQHYARAISVPFYVSSGKVLIEGPEEDGEGRFIATPPGHYRLTAAQWLVDEEEQSIDLFFEPLAEPLRASAILIADAALKPPIPLVESAATAGGD